MVGTSTVPGPRTSTGAPPPQVRLLGGGPKRWRWVVLGLALATTGALAGVTAVQGTDQAQGVLIADGNLPVGHVVTAQDLVVARIAVPEGVSVVAEAQLEEVLGRTLAVPVADGSLLPGTAIGPAEYPEADKAVIGAALEPGDFPASLRPGAEVSVVVIAEGPEETQRGVEAYPATIQSVEPAASDGSVVVELVVSSLDAAEVTTAAATENIALAQVKPRGDS
ncbi:SAF domain-containing protein [Nocardiopsis sp. LOL_012]|uniref:SAF domain-containing protein n=1 Tax=Nocardiopsis sp. LOL_012 TaxID=3345409 RepID=UPI003A84F151